MHDLLLFSAEGTQPPGRKAKWEEREEPPPRRPPVPADPSATVAGRMVSLADRWVEALRLRTDRTRAERRLQRLRLERQQMLEQRMAEALSYEEWEAAARELDELEQHENWKARDDDDDADDDHDMGDHDGGGGVGGVGSDEPSSHPSPRTASYNPELLRARLKDLEAARLSGDVRHMLHVVRTALSRDVGGISSAWLYGRSRTGTKHLVERYVQASVDLVRALVDHSHSAAALPRGLTHRAMLDQLLLARRSYGRSALVLSGGSVFGMAHIGVLKALYDRQLLPRIISGTSAGSIVAAVLCTRTDDEIPTLLAGFANDDLAVFTDEAHPDSWLTHIARALREGAWHDSRHIARVMRGRLGDMTFQEAFNRTHRVLNITVSSKRGLRLPSLLNYLTAPDVIVWSAVVASCSIPGVFDARPLLVRDAVTGEHVPWDPAEQLWVDGSLDNDVPVQRLREMLNVNHFIVSQTNPHILPFVSQDDQPPPLPSSAPSYSGALRDALGTLAWLGKSEALYCLRTLVDLGLFRDSLSLLLRMLNQRYTGDITILPRMSLQAWGTNLIRNPTPAFMLEACRVGEHATWPCISRIEKTCAVELALDAAVKTLRERIAFSDSQVNLRRFITGAYDLGSSRPSLPLSVDGSLGAPPVSASPFPVLPTTGPTAAPAPASPHRHKRRGSGGSVQLSARRQHNRNELETILSDDSGYDQALHARRKAGGGSNLRRSGTTSAGGPSDTRGDASANADPRPHLLRSTSYGVPPRAARLHSDLPPVPTHPAVWQSNMQQLFPAATATRPPNGRRWTQTQPVSPAMSLQSASFSPNTSFVRRSVRAPFIPGYDDPSVERNSSATRGPYSDDDDDDDDDDDYDDEGEDEDEDENGTDDEGRFQLPLQTRLRRRTRQARHRRRSSSGSSAMLAMSSAAVAAVSAAHQAVMQVVGGAVATAVPAANIDPPQERPQRRFMLLRSRSDTVLSPSAAIRPLQPQTPPRKGGQEEGLFNDGRGEKYEETSPSCESDDNGMDGV